MTVVYLDESTQKKLEEMKKDGNFNFSQFVRDAINKERKEILNPNEIKLEWENKESKIVQLKNEVEFLKEQERKIRVQLEAEELSKRDEELKKIRRKENLFKTWRNTCEEFVIIPEKEIDALLEEYYDSSREQDLLTFAKQRGYKNKIEDETSNT